MYERVPDPWLRRAEERLAAQAQDAQAQLDYICMMAGIDPLAEDGGEVSADGDEHAGE